MTYWCKLLEGKQSKYSYRIYQTCLELYNRGALRDSWLGGVKSILNDLGLSNVWLEQSLVNCTWPLHTIKQRLKDQALQAWSHTVNNSPKCTNYRIFKSELEFENYLDDLPRNLAITLCKFRTSNHTLPIERGRYRQIPRHLRLCPLCPSNKLGDEYHFLVECHALSDLRKRYLPTCLKDQLNCTSSLPLLCVLPFFLLFVLCCTLCWDKHVKSARLPLNTLL